MAAALSAVPISLSVKLRVPPPRGGPCDVFARLPGLVETEAVFPDAAEAKLRAEYVVRVQPGVWEQALAVLSGDDRVEHAERVPTYRTT